MTTTDITREVADDLVWITAAGNASGRLGCINGKPWMLKAAVLAIKYAGRIELQGPVGDGETFIMTIHTRGGAGSIYVRPHATPYDPDCDPWAPGTDGRS